MSESSSFSFSRSVAGSTAWLITGSYASMLSSKMGLSTSHSVSPVRVCLRPRTPKMLPASIRSTRFVVVRAAGREKKN